MAKNTFLYALFLCAALLLFSAGGAVASSQAAEQYSGCGGVASPPAINATYEQLLMELVNAQRLANGDLPPLKRVDALDRAARYHALDMAADIYFNHNTYDRNGSYALVYVCDTWARLNTYYTGYYTAGENIASGQSTPLEVIGDWMNSSGHRSNILSTEHCEIGVGYASGSYSPPGYYGTSWVQDFGCRTGQSPLVINREDALTSSTLVRLYIHGSWTSMRLRNDSDSWGTSQPFQNNLTWSLASLGGTRTVWVELTKPGQTHTTSDTIFLIDLSMYDHHIFLPHVQR